MIGLEKNIIQRLINTNIIKHFIRYVDDTKEENTDHFLKALNNYNKYIFQILRFIQAMLLFITKTRIQVSTNYYR